MARTDADAVKGILLDDYDPAPEVGDAVDLSPFIATATVIVSRVATCAAAKDLTLSAEELELIERWLAAHCYAMSDQTLASTSTEGASASFHGQTGMRLEATKYGQMATTLDFSGCLTAIDKRQVARGFWLGKPRSEQIPYVDRD